MGCGLGTLGSPFLWNLWAGGCLPFSVPLQSFHLVVKLLHVLMVSNPRRVAGLVLSLQSRPLILSLSLFPGPELPKPKVISQLEQGAELWVADRGITQSCCPGENPPSGDTYQEWDVTAGALPRKGGMLGSPRPPVDPVIIAKDYRTESAKGESRWGTIQRKLG